jgi:hypothetical protein
VSLATAVNPLSWQDRASCARVRPETFYPVEGGDTKRAKAYCAVCPVWRECLTYGLDEEHGIWGGLNAAERKRLQRLRRRLATKPDDPANAVDFRWLLTAGLSPARLGELTGWSFEGIVEAMAAIGYPRRGRKAAWQ